MTLAQAQLALASAFVLCQIGCSDDDAAESVKSGQPMPSSTEAGSAEAGSAEVGSADAGSTEAGSADAGSCTIASSCVDVDVGPLAARACCTAKSACGYILPELSPETLMFFPQAKDFAAMVTKDDPNGRCAPESFLFSSRPGFTEERFEGEGPDILVASGCSSYHLAAFSLAGCCLPDNTCGLSTHYSATTLGYLAEDPNVPFGRPECVHADVLNEQFRNSKLRSFARTTSSGSCNYAEIDARQMNYF